MIAYHFTAEKLRDGRSIPAIGEWLVHEGPVEICKTGLHASAHPFDALQYAPGPLLHRVECEGIVAAQSDKIVCRRRKIIASIDATDMLRKFACHQAMSVIHLWNAPAVVREYLKTGNEELRVAAWDAARDAEWDAARGAAWAAARNAARNAAWAAAWDAAWAAAGAAAKESFRIAVEAEFAKAEAA